MSAAAPSGRIVVTGAGGFIGSRLVHRLRAAGADVQGWTRHEVDLLDADSVMAAMRRDRPETIFHLAAAGVNAARAFDVDVIRQDVVMADLLLRHADDAARFVLAGTMSEYGRPGKLAESDRCDPHTPYAIAKLACSLHALSVGRRDGRVVQVARLFGVYGPGEAPARLFPALLSAMRARRHVALSDGLPRRDFIHVDDACAALVALTLAERTTGIVNIGTGVAVRVRDVAGWIAYAAGTPRQLLGFGERARSPNDEELLVADVTLLRANIGSPPPQRLAPGLSLSLFEEGVPADSAWTPDATR